MRGNEDRADRGRAIVDAFSDRNYRTDGADGMATDIADVIADLLHLGERYGHDTRLLHDADNSYCGDAEDGPAPELCAPMSPADLNAAGPRFSELVALAGIAASGNTEPDALEDAAARVLAGERAMSD